MWLTEHNFCVAASCRLAKEYHQSFARPFNSSVGDTQMLELVKRSGSAEVAMGPTGKEAILAGLALH